MKLLHYFKVLLFSLPLNILVYNKNKPYVSPFHTSTTRLLCECELYSSIYDNDPEMKAVMENYNRQTSQRLKEYDEHMIENRQKCKEKCNKEIQQIILKDKIEKELSQHFSTLETNISTNDIPTCVCEKSIEDKMERTCLKGTQNLGGIVTPSSVVLGGIAELAISVWKPNAIAAAIEAAKQAGLAKGLTVGEAWGLTKFIEAIKTKFFMDTVNVELLKSVFIQQSPINFSNVANYINVQYTSNCVRLDSVPNTKPICNIFRTLGLGSNPNGRYHSAQSIIGGKVNEVLADVKSTTAVKISDVATKQTAAIETAKKAAIETTCTSYHTSIIASIVAILVIVLVMVIIYLLLRYRRKKKLKKKLQYIKLLKE
ncbi:rifin [Plasmodium sp. gorilla clade G1]|nr:rifin [Plasmodium sp. gorilla clade G1]